MKAFNGKTVLITGATGLIGAELTKTLLREGEAVVYACARNREKFDTVFAEYLNCDRLIPVIGDINQPVELADKIDYIIHGASITASKSFVDAPVDTIKTALNGTQNILDFAAEKKVSGFVYLSSLEVYGVQEKMLVSESDYGFIDFLSVRSSYSEGKRMAECICAAYAAQYGVPVKIARLTQTMGAGIEYTDNRVFAQFAKSVIEKKDIVLHTPGRTVRSYCDISDAVQGILTVLLKGKPGEAYNIANEETAISIADMAKLVCDLYPEAGIQVIFDIPEDASSFGYNPEMKISLNTEKLRSLGWKPQVSLPEMYRRLIAGLRDKAK